jgi:hypothetical protein
MLIAEGLGDYAAAMDLEQAIIAQDGVHDIYLRALRADHAEYVLRARNPEGVVEAIAAAGEPWMVVDDADGTVTIRAAATVNL